MGLNSTPLDRGPSDPAPAAAADSGPAPEGGRTGVELARAGGRLGCARGEVGEREAGCPVRVFFLFVLLLLAILTRLVEPGTTVREMARDKTLYLQIGPII
jgi:hypothetical protein